MADAAFPTTEPEFLVKQPWEKRLYEMDFANLLTSGDSLGTVDSVSQSKRGRVAGSSDLTIGAASVSGTKVQFTIEGGSSGEDYKITVRVNTTAGNRLEGDGWLFVRDQ